MLNKKNIFILDAVGALISAACLGIVLPMMQNWVGLPVTTLYFLSMFPMLFAVYSLSCFYYVDHANPKWLNIISTLNTLYCILTFSILCFHWNDVQNFGALYFISEIIIVLWVVAVERKIIIQLKEKSNV